jgi:acyl carrier protein
MTPASTGISTVLPWEMEWRVIGVVNETLGFQSGKIGPESRLLRDVAFDSLDMMELVMRLEEEFQVTLTEEWWNQVFSRPQAVTLRQLALAIHERMGTEPSRPSVAPHPRPAALSERAPFLQLSGRASKSDWLDGPLHRLLGPNRDGLLEYRRLTDGMRCIALPSAEVIPGGEGWPGRVELSPFFIDAEPVANCAFARFLNSVGTVPPAVLLEWCGTPKTDQRGAQFGLKRSWGRWVPHWKTARQPVILVSWYGAAAYSLWAHRFDWRYYRGDGSVPAELASVKVDAPPPPAVGLCLPSELQWEYAARGPEPRRYPWGEGEPTADLLCVAQHQPGASYSAGSLPAADVCARLGMSPFGVHHMAGNVWQWCRDWYAPGNTPIREPAPTGIRSERGGSWVGPARLAQCDYRRGRPPLARGRCLGFRCVGANGQPGQPASRALSNSASLITSKMTDRGTDPDSPWGQISL